jgi:hypothetical protein
MDKHSCLFARNFRKEEEKSLSTLAPELNTSSVVNILRRLSCIGKISDFFRDKHFLPRLMFESKAGTYSYGAPLYEKAP